MRLPLPLLIALAAGAALPAAAAPKVPLSAFAGEDSFANPRLSPDGKHIVITVRVPIGERAVPVVTFYALPSLKIDGQLRLPVFQVPLDYTWVSNTRVVIEKGLELGSREKPVSTGELLATDFDGSKQEYLFGMDNFKSSTRGARYGDDYASGWVSATPRERNGHVFVSANPWEAEHSELFDIDSGNAVRKQLASLPHRDLRYVMENAGRARFAYGRNDEREALLYKRDDATGNWNLQAHTGSYFEPLAFSADDKEFTALFAAKGEAQSLIRQNVVSGARTVLFEKPELGEFSRIYGARRGELIGVRTSIGVPQTFLFDANNEDAKLHKLLTAQFPGSVVHFIDFTDDGKQLLFSVSSDRDPGAYYLFNRATGKADMLFTSMQAIEPEDMAERRPVSFKARDGLDLHGYLTVPAHAAGTRLPLVLMPHGGPHGIFDEWYFDTDAQFLASRGYAVLQVNYRGSGGRGQNFEFSGYRQWGSKIQDDLIDGVKWASNQADIDGKRVCAYGASFGGYAALMLAAREPAMFKCAVGYAGVYDLSLIQQEDKVRRDKSLQTYWRDAIGEDPAELARFSPASQAAKITSPVLLVHGGKDKRAPLKHAELMREALTKAGHPPEWLMMPNEGHGFYDTKNVTAFYEKLEAFLAKHLGK